MKSIVATVLVLLFVGCAKTPYRVAKDAEGVGEVISLPWVSVKDFPLAEEISTAIVELQSYADNPKYTEHRAELLNRIIEIKKTEDERRAEWGRFVSLQVNGALTYRVSGKLRGLKMDYLVVINDLKESGRFWIENPRDAPDCFPQAGK